MKQYHRWEVGNTNLIIKLKPARIKAAHVGNICLISFNHCVKSLTAKEAPICP